MLSWKIRQIACYCILKTLKVFRNTKHILPLHSILLTIGLYFPILIITHGLGLSNRSPNFLKVLLWTLAIYSVIFSLVLEPDHFQRNVLSLTYELFKNVSKSRNGILWLAACNKNYLFVPNFFIESMKNITDNTV